MNEYMQYFIKRIQDRLWKFDKNYLAIVTGQTGSGKSLSALKLAQLINPDFNVKEDVIFTPLEFLERIQGEETPLEQGDILIWDEMGAGADSREAMTKENRCITQNIETFRHMNCGLIMTVPGFGMVDSRIRKLTHQYFEAIKILYDQNVCLLKALDMQYNPKLDKIYYHNPRFHGVIMDQIGLKKPKAKIVNQYVRKKRAYLKEMNRKHIGQINPEKKQEKTIESMAQEIVEKGYVEKYEKGVNKDRVKWAPIKKYLDVGVRTAKQIRDHIESMETHTGETASPQT